MEKDSQDYKASLLGSHKKIEIEKRTLTATVGPYVDVVKKTMRSIDRISGATTQVS